MTAPFLHLRAPQAKKQLGFTALWNLDAALRLTLDSFKHLKNPNPVDKKTAAVGPKKPR